MKKLLLILLCLPLLFTTCKKENIEGCTDYERAINFDANATTDDGSCSYFSLAYKWSFVTDSLYLTSSRNSVVMSTTSGFPMDAMTLTFSDNGDGNNLVLDINDFMIGSNIISEFDISGDNLASFILGSSWITGWNDELFTGEIFYSSENNKMNGNFVFTARSEYTTTNGSYSTVGVSGKFQNIPFQ